MTEKEKFPKLMEALEKASFTAYSDIRADEKSLHGNVATVVRLETAKAIVRGLGEKLREIRTQEDESHEWTVNRLIKELLEALSDRTQT